MSDIHARDLIYFGCGIVAGGLFLAFLGVLPSGLLAGMSLVSGAGAMFTALVSQSTYRRKDRIIKGLTETCRQWEQNGASLMNTISLHERTIENYMAALNAARGNIATLQSQLAQVLGDKVPPEKRELQ